MTKDSQSIENWGIHWFRRDLRVSANSALRWNWHHSERKTLGLFCFDSKFLSREDFSHHRFAFFMNTLESLRQELRGQGGDLLIVDELPHLAFPKIVDYCKENHLSPPKRVSWNRDYEPFARLRDESIHKILQDLEIQVHTDRDHLIFEPEEILKDDGTFYQVYSPFARRWLEAFATPEGQKRLSQVATTQKYYDLLRNGKLEKIFDLNWSDLFKKTKPPFEDAFEHFQKENQKQVEIPIPAGGFAKAYERLLEFSEQLEQYKDQRDFPAVDGTSQLSMYLKNGSITSAQIIHTLNLQNTQWQNKGGKGQFLREIIWREFYYSILWHRPDMEKTSFLEQYEDLPWENNSEWFKRWCEGQTGFPIVDAGMRQLKTTGWMHNRVRMIVASFLTKDLLIDWRWGENHFMKYLLDGDLAPNNGGWQWAASTGCDPQPYFRIFNPWLQSAKFDPEGEYIKQFVPELKDCPPKALHDAEHDRTTYGYVSPLVDHAIQKQRALKMYQEAAEKKKPGGRSGPHKNR